MTRDDVLLIVLIGHGTFDGTDAKFNLVGRDLESAEWSELLRPLPGASSSSTRLVELSVPRTPGGPATDRGHRDGFGRRSVSIRCFPSTSSGR